MGDILQNLLAYSEYMYFKSLARITDFGLIVLLLAFFMCTQFLRSIVLLFPAVMRRSIPSTKVELTCVTAP